MASAAPSQPSPAPESQEELRAWNAFDKARELHQPDQPNERKRKASSSPASPQEPEPEPKKLKRPRLRRPAANAGSPPAESSRAATQRAAEGTTFLSSLLREVENNPSSAGSPGPSSAQYSPRNSSPARSPGSSGYGSPWSVLHILLRVVDDRISMTADMTKTTTLAEMHYRQVATCHIRQRRRFNAW